MFSMWGYTDNQREAVSVKVIVNKEAKSERKYTITAHTREQTTGKEDIFAETIIKRNIASWELTERLNELPDRYQEFVKPLIKQMREPELFNVDEEPVKI